MTTWYWYLFTSLLFILFVLLAYFIGKSRTASITAREIPNILSLYKDIRELPSRVLATIQGSINPQKGKVAELLTYAQLRYEYDYIIPLGRPIDFIGIKAGERIDFIEVKSGGGTLSSEELAVSKLVTAGKVHFRLVYVRDENLRDLVEGDELIINRPLHEPFSHG